MADQGSDAALDALTGQPWTGNVRELENTLRAGLALALALGSDVIGLDHLGVHAAPVDAELGLVEAHRRVAARRRCRPERARTSRRQADRWQATPPSARTPLRPGSRRRPGHREVAAPLPLAFLLSAALAANFTANTARWEDANVYCSAHTGTSVSCRPR